MTQLAPLQINLPDEPDRYSALDPLDGRYYDGEVSHILSERSRISYQAYLEAALAQTLAEHSICSKEVADEIEQAARAIDPREVAEQEKTTRHDIKAIVNTLKMHISEAAQPYVHFGATSYDIISSAQSLQLRDATLKLVVPRLQVLIDVLAAHAEQYKSTVQIGRTHGQHAVPITFGFLLANYVSRLEQTSAALASLAQALPGKFAGATGSYNALNIFVDDPIAFEQDVLEKVGLRPSPISTQIIPAESTVRLIDELAIAAGIMANLAHDMRHLQRSEIGEVREKFEKGQTGSSTMAHKKNPWNFENVISMSKQVTAQIINANLNIASEHQRDLTDSASSRFYPIVFATVGAMAKRLTSIMANIEVDEEAMQRNLRLTNGAFAAEPLYLLLAKYGHTEAHEAAKVIAHKALDEKSSLFEVAANNANIASFWSKFTAAEKALLKDPESHYTGLAATKVDHILSRRRQA